MVPHSDRRAVTYCIDTSSLIAAWNERYPRRNAPGFWSSLEGAIGEGEIVSPIEVRHEVERRDGDLLDWLKVRGELFVDLEQDIQLEARAILRQFPWLTKGILGRTVADPFVIALAKARNLTVVTEEGPGGERKPQIPYVCQQLGVPCINLLGLIQTEDWRL